MRYFIVVFALAGMILSSITLGIHYSGDGHEVVSKSSWNSEFVNHSSYAVVGGIPVAVFGIVGYTVLALLTWHRRKTLTVIAALLGLAFALLSPISRHTS